MFMGERFLRWLRCRFLSSPILEACLLPGEVLQLKIQKPRGFRLGVVAEVVAAEGRHKK